jgi:hypothetical protein
MQATIKSQGERRCEQDCVPLSGVHWLIRVGRYDFWLDECRFNVPRSYELNFHDLLEVLLEVYIEDVVVKSVGFEEHMTDLKLSLERLNKCGLRLNPLKCAFGVTSGRFLGFIVHEHGIQIDPKKIESIRKIGEPVCKRRPKVAR